MSHVPNSSSASLHCVSHLQVSGPSQAGIATQEGRPADVQLARGRTGAAATARAEQPHNLQRGRTRDSGQPGRPSASYSLTAQSSCAVLCSFDHRHLRRFERPYIGCGSKCPNRSCTPHQTGFALQATHEGRDDNLSDGGYATHPQLPRRCTVHWLPATLHSGIHPSIHIMKRGQSAVGAATPKRKRPPVGRSCFGSDRLSRDSESKRNCSPPERGAGSAAALAGKNRRRQPARRRQPGLRARATLPARLPALWSSLNSMERAAQGPAARRARRSRPAHAARVGSKKTALAVLWGGPL